MSVWVTREVEDVIQVTVLRKTFSNQIGFAYCYYLPIFGLLFCIFYPSRSSRESGPFSGVQKKEVVRMDLEVHRNEIFGFLGHNGAGKTTSLSMHRFLDVQKNLTLGFHWTLEVRRAFADYMRSQHWNVVECPTEADPMIATECQHGDIVVTRDSDALVYKNIETIWRPISKDHLYITFLRFSPLSV
ncbi:hypothetical protein BGZ65_009906 [Modicella reniformis]|uniref:ABC transporter domain-containing protein n=1 Tax=Modicella reniformis TaxID=1440133 RepID=A0A9P6ME50_9FUNG|nr:hypothetical protein BGZ65_009906 [Modicella reniformis]